VGNELNLSSSLIECFDFETKSHAEIYSDGPHNQLQVVVHAFVLQNCPLNEEGDKFLSADYRRRRAKYVRNQIHIVVPDSHTVLTVRRASQHEEFDNIFREVLGSLRERFKGKVNALNIMSPASLLAEIMEVILNNNWSALDQLNDWHDMVEASIELSADDKYQVHVADIENLAKELQRSTLQFQVTLKSLSETEEKFISPNIHAFVKDDIELQRSNLRMCDRFIESLDSLLVKCSSLKDKFTTEQANKANRTLYLLTLITFLIAPVQIAASIYGMNFVHMPELHYEDGYFVFLGISGFWFALVVLWVLRHQNII